MPKLDLNNATFLQPLNKGPIVYYVRVRGGGVVFEGDTILKQAPFWGVRGVKILRRSNGSLKSAKPHYNWNQSVFPFNSRKKSSLG